MALAKTTAPIGRAHGTGKNRQNLRSVRVRQISPRFHSSQVLCYRSYLWQHSSLVFQWQNTALRLTTDKRQGSFFVKQTYCVSVLGWSWHDGLWRIRLVIARTVSDLPLWGQAGQRLTLQAGISSFPLIKCYLLASYFVPGRQKKKSNERMRINYGVSSPNSWTGRAVLRTLT